MNESDLYKELGFSYPASARDCIGKIVFFLDSDIPILRERAVNALGRIGRGSYQLIEPSWENRAVRIHCKGAIKAATKR